MKQIMMVCALLCSAVGASAQDCMMARVGVFNEGDKVVVENPTTTLAVDFTYQKEEVLCGPYARYAQKFFGVRAPLTDKTTYTIAGASISQTNLEQYLATAASAVGGKEVLSHSRSDREFARIMPDKTDLTTLPLEDAAREAATAVFSLRKHRMDLITGEAGENVFGAGLKAALDEIEYLEQSYLELFLGKRIVTTESYRRAITPVEGKQQYIFCRFSPDQGFVRENDLSGDVVLLQIDPTGIMPAIPYEVAHKEGATIAFRIADRSVCTLSVGSRVLVQQMLPIFQFGRTIHVMAPRKK